MPMAAARPSHAGGVQNAPASTAIITSSLNSLDNLGNAYSGSPAVGGTINTTA
jgi:hypothetical protein